MALGLTTTTADGASFMPILKYDARAGRMFRVDREQDDYGQWETNNVEITDGFNAIFDLEQIQVGWAHFANGVAPSFVMVPLGSPLPPKPSDDHRQCFKLLVKLGKSSSANGVGDVREFSSSATAVITAMDGLHTAFEAGRGQNAGKLPVVAMTGSTPITTSGKGQSSTNYAPTFDIVRWVGRPQDLPGPDKAHQSLPKTAPAASGGKAKPPIADDFDDPIPF